MAKVVRTDSELEVSRVDAALRDAGHELILLADGVGEAALIEAIRDAELLLMCYTPVTARVIDAATKLKGIVKYGVGIDAIDIEAAQRRSIPVVNVPEYAEETVAEGAFALLMALAKKIKPIQHAMQTEGWIWPTPRWMAQDLSGKTVGLVGVGKIGSSFARMAAAFRMRVLAFDPNPNAATRNPSVQFFDDLRTMLAQCDFVSIHCVLNRDTRHLIGETELRAMKRTALLLNVSRGAIVDEAALLRALQRQRIAGAALDVYSHEPLMQTNHALSALYAMDNVIVWPHLTFYTHEAMQRLEEETIARAFEVLRDEPLLIKSHDPRLRAQQHAVRFAD